MVQIVRICFSNVLYFKLQHILVANSNAHIALLQPNGHSSSSNGHIAIGYCHWQGSGNSQKNLNASPHSSTMANLQTFNWCTNNGFLLSERTSVVSPVIFLIGWVLLFFYPDKLTINIVRTGTEASAGKGEKAKTGIQTRSKTKAGSQTKTSRS